ncbi:MAG: glycosyltransferase family A protein [Erythrobacter sp.]|uniref:glycosyltransferase family 2 protein n=1 Tax=Erythrobacter sp. TaxID=1042 RepID=UPI0032667FE1
MPQPAPKITVLMTVFNGERYLMEAVDSILAQTMPNFELLVIDDQSTDSTVEILTTYAALDDRVRVLRNIENSGPYPSANIGLAQARAPLIARMDADDICAPDRLERQLTFMEKSPNCMLVGGGYRSIDGHGKQNFIRHNAMDFATCAFVTRLRMPMVHPSFCFRVKLPDGTPVRYNEDIPIAGDYALAAGLAARGKIASLNAILVDYRMHAANISSTKLDRQQHFAHATSEKAIAAHYPPEIAYDLKGLLDVLYHQKPVTKSRLSAAIRGLDAAIQHDCGSTPFPSVKERAAGILAEAFAKSMPFSLLTKAPHYLLPLVKRYGRLKNTLPQRTD